MSSLLKVIIFVVITYIEQWGRIMEQLRFSGGLVTPLILYGRVIFSRRIVEPHFDQSL